MHAESIFFVLNNYYYRLDVLGFQSILMRLSCGSKYSTIFCDQMRHHSDLLAYKVTKVTDAMLG
jgi:hypothetical protein